MPIMAAAIKRDDNAVATDQQKGLRFMKKFSMKLERGEKTPNVAMLGKIATLFQISFDHLLDDEIEVDG